MRPTKIQIDLCIEALGKEGPSKAGPEQPGAVPPVDEQFVIDLTDRITREATVRPEVVSGARLLLDPRLAPSASDVADAWIGRLVCDRIR